MDINLPSHDTSLEYIDMQTSSYLCRSSLQHQREFEFQMSTDSLQREATTSSADELFYKGKLLPLHLLPRIEMVEKLLWNSLSSYEEFYGNPLAVIALVSMMVSTPFELCDVTPCEFCSIRRELCPEVFSREYSTMDDCLKKGNTTLYGHRPYRGIADE